MGLDAVVAVLLLAGAPEAATRELRVLVPDPDWSGVAPVSGLPSLQWDVLGGLARVHDVTLKRVAVRDRSEILASLTAGKADVAAGGLTCAELRAAGVPGSDEVVASRLVVVNRRPHAPYGFLEELRGHKIGVVEGSVAETAAGEAKMHGVEPRGSGALAAALREGQVDAAIMDLHEALAAQRADAELQLGVFLGPRQGICFAAAPGGTALIGSINAYLAQIRSSSSWAVVLGRHLGPSGLQALGRARLGQP